jgi:hypothetical protein
VREQQPLLYVRAAARWAARFALEADAVRLPDLGLAVAALHALNGAERDAGIAALASLCRQHGRHDIVGVLERWARARPG